MKPEKLILTKLIENLNKEIEETKTSAIEDTTQNVEFYRGYYSALKETMSSIKQIATEVEKMFKQQDKENFD